MIPHITALIPHRHPMLLVDEVSHADSLSCHTVYTVSAECFLVDGGRLSEAGLVENMAQSASALAGWHALLNGASGPPVGTIGEVSHLHIHSLPLVGQTLSTEVSFGIAVGSIRTLTASVTVNGVLAASARFKINIEQ